MSIRTERVAAQIKRDLGSILQNYQRGSMLTVTTVRVSDDLMIAKVYLSIYAPGNNKDAVFEHIMDQSSAIRTELAALVRHQLRRVPELHFYLDDTAEYVNKIESLFQQIRKDKA
jgi:ribosome-binding factor A